MKGRTRLYVFAGVFLVIIYLVYSNRQPTEKTQIISKVGVVVAKQDIPPYSILAATDLYTVALPVGQTLNLIGEQEMPELVGQITTVELRTGNPLKRADTQKVPTWFNTNRNDMLIFSFYVPTDRIVGGKLRPGHYIDLGATRPGTGIGEKASTAVTLARNLWVIGVQQTTGREVGRPTMSIYSNITPQGSKSGGVGGGVLGIGAGAPVVNSSDRQEQQDVPANLVVIAAHRAIFEMVSDYLGARLYGASVAIRVGQGTGDLGRVDGVVTEYVADQDDQNRPVPGIDGVRITLYDASGAKSKEVQTNSGGRFTFDRLAQGDYYVEEADPQGYVSLSSNRLAVFLADGENLHLTFSDQRLTTPTPYGAVTVPPGPGPSVTGIPSASPKPIATPTSIPPKPEGTGNPVPPTPPPGACGLYMSSDAQGSVSRVNFAARTQEVWAVLMFNQYPKNAYSVRVLNASTGQERQVSSGNWEGGSGAVAVLLKAGAGSAGEFPAGAYITILKTSPDTICGEPKWWFVDTSTPPSTTRTPSPGGQNPSPEPTWCKCGADIERQR